MTRINTCIPRALTDQHLIGEYNEIRRPVKLALNKYNKLGNRIHEIVPNTYRLGAGHVLFFYNKLKYLHDRFEAIKEEMVIRGFNPQGTFDISDIPPDLYKDWSPSQADNQILLIRLLEKIETSNITWRYNKKAIDSEYRNTLTQAQPWPSETII